VPLALACALLASCIVVPIPTPGHKVLSGQPVTDEQLAFLQAGKTTRAEVHSNLGAPDILWEDADIYVYQWELRQGMLFWAVGGGYQAVGGMADIPKHHLLLIDFDRRGRVRRFEKAVRPLGTPCAEFLKDWARQSPPGTPKAGP